ncbi:MAG: UDP-N-acetylmuramate dehydrogenase [Leptolyngbya sp. PLA3]|nr:MAG: UDP-N-acetylmuramate dehydrogenase [Cyanobacteria bacterium CYA]MCE7969932.1 UDP-N-acetylmuramate dehydrogenase [Leptolyngbya sp. PL-A3]
MKTMAIEPKIINDAPIPTWYGVGGRADRMIVAESDEQVAWAIGTGEPVRVLGEGANLLVDDVGVDGFVVSLRSPGFDRIEIDPRSHMVKAGAGADLRRLITVTSNAGLAGLEILGGIPASVGGAVCMNAGGKFGQISQLIAGVRVIDQHGCVRRLGVGEIEFGYRCSGLEGLVIVEAEFALVPEEASKVRARFRDYMGYKKETQPLAENSAGCVFKNPTLLESIEGVGPAGSRVSAGRLIDLTGCKGLSVGGAEVSRVHGNFLTARKGACARDLIELMDEVARRVFDRFGVRLEREVVVWSRQA